MQTGVYRTGVAVKGTPEGKAEVHQELIEGLEVLIKNNIDLIIVDVSMKIQRCLLFIFFRTSTLLKKWSGQ